MAALLAGLLATASFVLPATAQLSGTVGPTTSTSAKAATKVCNILDYGGVASATTDNGAAIQSAWDACKSGGQVYIPEGDYGMATWVTLKSGTGVSINIEGTIYRTGTDGGNMIMIRDSSDVEVYSATSKGAMQGYGYEFHSQDTYGPRLLRFYKCTDFSVHDLILVDSPAFHLSLDTCTNGELYNMIIRGANEGGLDGIDVWSTNIWIHDIEVTNKDECVTVKSPADHILVEQVHCNWSGGCAMGSLGSGVAVHDIEYRNIYTHHANQMYMIKSNGGDGDVYNVAFNNFMGHSNAYTLDFDTAWSSMSAVDGDGITYSNISFSNWKGTASNGVQRGPVKLNCPSKVPCTDITVEDFAVWTESGSSVLYGCQNAYGSGVCLNDGSSHTAYTTTQTVTTVAGYSYSTMAGELTAGLGLTASIAIPTMPASFYPGLQPISAILNGAAGGSASAAEAVAASTTASSSAAVKTSSAASSSSSSAKSSSSTTKAAKTSKTTGSKVGAEAVSTSSSSAPSVGITSSAPAPIVTSVASSSSSSAPAVSSSASAHKGCKRSAKFRA
ncbi:rhamnogalacturonase B [Pestalotiopsis fici W106-1]|uniref:Rhamnogalacturonase B n=1 Tax=Pestalotiopsis fici (strain W106-1 / CGMCC3.15140) TaxID=1229662 RepID=W3WR23_PESFW|nr:rhamnogalacturonase B [Pestalotiopsis fici W106-1]ETS76288.1 rhamnogalacturonase B [Pestalotiopsis fici W106-1]